MFDSLATASTRFPAPTLRPWFMPSDGAPALTQCCCRCGWTTMLGALQQAGPVALVLRGPLAPAEAPSALAAGLALGGDWRLRAAIGPSGVDESVHWSAGGHAFEIHALPSSNWRPFDRLARLHACQCDRPPLPRAPASRCAAPLLVDAEFRLQLMPWSRLTRLDQEHGEEWMKRNRIRPLSP